VKYDAIYMRNGHKALQPLHGHDRFETYYPSEQSWVSAIYQNSLMLASTMSGVFF